MQTYDRSSKWLIQHHGDAILRIAGVGEIASWRALAPEVVQPRKLPDGLVEARRAGHAEPDLFVLELMTYPDDGLVEQVFRDLALVYLDRRALPEVLALVLCPKGNLRAAPEAAIASPIGWAGLRARWKVVELWTVPAEQLLAIGDVGAMPWVPLGRIDGPPEPVLRRCRERIDREAAPEEVDNMLAVAQVLMRLRYNDPALREILGGEKAMIESPLLQELKDRWGREAAIEATVGATRKHILAALEVRFGPEAAGLAEPLGSVDDPDRLDELHRLAVACPSLDAFRQGLLTGG